MTLLGRLLRDSRPDEARSAWNRAALVAPETLEVRSDDFADGGPLRAEHAGRRAGGSDVSPHLAWSGLPAGTAELLVVVEDLDSPLVPAPVVHAMALLDPAALGTIDELPAGALVRGASAPGVTLLPSTFGRGYRGPGPVRGHGPHRYVFQVFALGAPLRRAGAVLSGRPRRVLSAVDVSVLARGRTTGTYER